jgi:hypothetical protein
MFSATAIEVRAALEPVTADTFIADLASAPGDGGGRLAEYAARVAESPRLRIYD